jgi:SpoVK/Ycf46/Vps4 family AAA+-type ATPase
MKLNAFVVVAVLAAGAIATGCGSSDDNGDSTTTASLTKAEWIAKADAICRQGNQQINQAAHQQFGNQKPTAAEVQQFTANSLIPNVQSQVDQIQALGASSGEEDQVNKILDTVQADIDKAKSDPNTISDKTFADGNALAQQYGLKVCGK